MTAPNSRTIDIHTHIYPPSYITLLKSRTSIPYIHASSSSPSSPTPSLRLVILPSEDNEPSTSLGRPIGPEYWDINSKITFMNAHSISISVLSLANPWLDWVPSSLAAETAITINNEINTSCSQYPGRFYFFATLPLSGGKVVILDEIKRIKGLQFARGFILGTTGLGKGLDDEELLPIFQALQDLQIPLFLHPHYGLPSSFWGEGANEYGHVLPLSLGFPMETTIAITRMFLSGVFEKLPNLQVILAHSGGTLPFLAGRIESCIQHDRYLKAKGKKLEEERRRKTIWDVLKKNVYLDAVIYSEIGLKAAVEVCGLDRVMFGTDHPFFPPLDGNEERWASVESNRKAVVGGLGGEGEEAKAVFGGNAVRVLRLEM